MHHVSMYASLLYHARCNTALVTKVNYKSSQKSWKLFLENSIISNKYDKKLTFDGVKLPVIMGYTLHYHIRNAI